MSNLSLLKYPAGFVDDLVSYGREFAVRVLDQKKYHLFDPMVSDRSCQLRAIWLACFWQFKKKTEELNEEDLLIFGLVRFLCEAALSAEHEIIGRCPLKTCSSYWPNEVVRLNSAGRMRFLGVAKALLMERILADMYRWLLFIDPKDLLVGRFSADLEQVYIELLRGFANPVHTFYSDVAIPVVTFFPGFVALMSLAAHFKVPLVAEMRRVERNPEGFLYVAEEARTRFMYDPKRHAFFEEDAMSRRSECPAVVFSGHSYLEGGQIQPAHMVESLNRYSNLEASVMDYIYGVMATHEAFPRGADDQNRPDEPLLSQLTSDYLRFAQSAHVHSYETVMAVYDATRSNSLKDLEIHKTACEITHVCSV